MVRHCSEHEKNPAGITKIFETRAGAARPEEHQYNVTTGKYWAGSDAKFARFIVGPGAKVDAENNKYFCAYCEKFGVEIDRNMSTRKIGKRIGKLRKHERKCGNQK